MRTVYHNKSYVNTVSLSFQLSYCASLMPFSSYKDLACTVAMTSAVWESKSKNRTNFFFPLHSITDKRFVPAIDLSNLRTGFFFSFLSKSRTFTSSFKKKKKNPYGFFLVYPNGLPHYPCSLEPLWGKIRVVGTQALQYLNIGSEDSRDGD